MPNDPTPDDGESYERRSGPVPPVDLSEENVDALWRQAETITPDMCEQALLVVYAVTAGWTPEQLAAMAPADTPRLLGIHPEEPAA